jgi:hypothetical protein
MIALLESLVFYVINITNITNVYINIYYAMHTFTVRITREEKTMHSEVEKKAY